MQAAQIEDGIADELSGAVVGDVAAAVDLVKGDTAAGKQFIGGEDVGAAGVAAKGEYRGMFEQEKNVFDTAIETESGDLSLNAKCLVVGDATETEILDHRSSYSRERGIVQSASAWFSALGTLFKDAGKGIADAKEDQQPEDGHKGCNGKTARSHEDVGEVYVEDDRS